MSSHEEMYRENVFELFKNPLNYGKLEGSNCSCSLSNLICGDNIFVEIILKDGEVKDIKFTGSGCAVSIACASALSEDIKGRNEKEILGMGLNYVEDLLEIKISAGRSKCALLFLDAVKEALRRCGDSHRRSFDVHGEDINKKMEEFI